MSNAFYIVLCVLLFRIIIICQGRNTGGKYVFPQIKVTSVHNMLSFICSLVYAGIPVLIVYTHVLWTLVFLFTVMFYVHQCFYLHSVNINVYLHVQGHGRSIVSNVSTNFILTIRPCYIFKFTQNITTLLTIIMSYQTFLSRSLFCNRLINICTLCKLNWMYSFDVMFCVQLLF